MQISQLADAESAARCLVVPDSALCWLTWRGVVALVSGAETLRMVRLVADRGRMAQTLLDHPIDIEAEVLDRWQLSYATRWSGRPQISVARELLWIETIDAGR